MFSQGTRKIVRVLESRLYSLSKGWLKTFLFNPFRGFKEQISLGVKLFSRDIPSLNLDPLFSRTFTIFIAVGPLEVRENERRL